MKYRADLDGIRALAILPVLFFHAELNFLHQGYLGVDIFFVLSGFLIGAYLINDIESNGRINFANFYERRVRRIFPALLFMMLIVSIVSLFVYTPHDLIAYAKSQISSVLSVSNIFFWRQSSYFDTSNNLKPLLHTWSLSVEEQFYVFFPWLLFLIRSKSKESKLIVICLIIFISLSVAQILSFLKPVASFYLLPTRSYELLLGVLATQLLTFPSFVEKVKEIKQLKADILSVSIIFIIIAMMALPVDAFPLPSPGIYSFLISGFTALLCILGIRQTVGNRLLSFAPFVWIGLISYSLYLWHQPIFAITRYISPYVLKPTDYVYLILITFVIAFLSWKFVESPFRNRKGISNKKIWLIATFTGILIILFSTLLVVFKGFPNRFSIETNTLMSMSLEGRHNAEICSASRDKPFEINKMCILGKNNDQKPPNFMLWGDSHAAAISPAVSVFLGKKNLSAYQATYLGCPPGIDIERVDNNFKCLKFNQDVMSFINQHAEIDTIIISARWALMSNLSGFDNGEGGIEQPERPKYKSIINQNPIESSIDLIKKLLAINKTVILVYPIPEVGLIVPMTVYRLNKEITTNYSIFKKRTESIIKEFDEINHEHLIKIKPAEILCSELTNRCIATKNKTPLYYDDDHLSVLGSQVALIKMEHYLNR